MIAAVGRGLLLAQDTTFTDFLSQVRGLVLFICVLSVLWVVLFVLSLQRGAERRRRAKLGLPPPPGFWVWSYRWLTGRTEDLSAVRSATASPALDPSLIPDLDLLTGDLPDLDLPPAVIPEAARTLAETPPAPIASPPAEDAVPPEDTPMALTPESSPESRPLAPAAPDAPPPPDAVELLRVFRDLSDGALIVEIGGQRFRSLAELRSADLERRFSAVVRDLVQMVRGAARPAAVPPAPAPTLKPAAPPPPGALPDTELPSMAPGALLKQMVSAARGQKPDLPPAEPVPSLSVAEEIDALLQARLATLPEFRGRTIQVRTALGGGVRIQVDDHSYEGIGEVAEDDVRALLQDVVREWERKK